MGDEARMREPEERLIQITFKVPESWQKEMLRVIGKKMAETGQEYTLAGLVRQTLKEKFKL